MKITLTNDFGLHAVTIPDKQNLRQPQLWLYLKNEQDAKFFDDYFENLYGNYPAIERTKKEVDDEGVKIFLRGTGLVASTLKKIILDIDSLNVDSSPLVVYLQKIEEQCSRDFVFLNIEVPGEGDKQSSIRFKIKADGRDDWYFFNDKDFLITSTQCDLAYIENYIVCTVRGKRSVYHIINKMLQYREKGCPLSLINALSSYQLNIASSFKPVDIKKLPLRGLCLSQLTEVKLLKAPVSGAFHAIKMYKDSSGNFYVLKFNTVRRKITEFEAAISWIYKTLLLDKAAASRPVYDEQGARIGVASEYVENFLDFCSQQGYLLLTEENLIKGGLGAIQAVALAFHEDDLQPENIGFIKQLLKLVKIDHDRSLFDKLCIYFNRLPNVERYTLKYKCMLAPAARFAVSSSDILNMPKIQDAKPNKWLPDLMPFIDWNKVAADSRYQHDVRKHTVEVALLDRNFYQKVADAHFTSVKGHKTFTDMCTEISENNFKLIVNSPELSKFVMDMPGLQNEILNEFKEYNTFCSQVACEQLQIEISVLQKSFQSLATQCSTQPSPKRKFAADIVAVDWAKRNSAKANDAPEMQDDIDQVCELNSC